ncbi:hypothetical protein [Pseudomonas viridiflava]|uniref:hypothetical protein n=1 Tax=Pseudomonas viridiflava TaxID=33069 RepID=UPI0013C2DF19|nr:hypothetical protein [Pseudomonas viridiflava]
MSKWLGLREDQARARCLICMIIGQLPEPPRSRACPGNRSRSLRPVAESPASKVAG